MNIVRPTLVLDKSKCLQNIETMYEKAKKHKLRFRPHFKTHQSYEIGRWFREIGVNCITVSSVKMAQYFINDGWNDITIAFPFNIHEIENLNELCHKAYINIVVDNIDTINTLKNRLTHEAGIYIKITTGYNRVGISSSSIKSINQLISRISTIKELNFKGFISHTGQTYEAKTRNEVQNIHFEAVQKLNNLKKHFIKKHPNIEISIGDTPSCSISDYFIGIDEIRPGNFVFYDLTQHNIGVCKIDDIAISVHCPVVSIQAKRNEIVIYGGAVHFSKDWIENTDGKPLYGRIVINNSSGKMLLNKAYYLCRISQEHGVLKVPSHMCKQIKIGDIIEILPVHSCLTAQAMGIYHTINGEIISMMHAF